MQYVCTKPVRIRISNSTIGASNQWLKIGDVIDGTPIGESDGHEWIQYEIRHGSVVALAFSAIRETTGKRPATYLEAVKPDSGVPAVVSKPWQSQHDRYLHGIHELCCNKAREAHANGVGALMYFNNALSALQDSVAHPHLLCMHRIYFNQPINPLELLKQHAINPVETSRSRAWLRGVNEYDVAGFGGSPEEIKRRAEFDEQAARALRKAAPDAVWVGGGFPHGCPDFNDAAVCDAMRAYYAPLYNSGLMAFDMHNYSKTEVATPKDYRRIASIWLERRWEFLFTKCGFDPRIRMIVSSETGLEGPNGGFAQQGFTHDEFGAWCSYYSGVQRAPLEVGGKSYPSPFIASTHFQAGGAQQGRWLGYEMQGYLPVVYARAKAAGIGQGAETANQYAGGELERGYVPARKAIIEQPGIVVA